MLKKYHHQIGVGGLILSDLEKQLVNQVLDYNRLLTEASNEKEALITQLREDLEATTTLKQAERSTAESEQTQQQYTVDNPYQIYIH